MSETASSAPTQFLQTDSETYAYRRSAPGPGHPLLFLQHFTGTLDNWDPAVIDRLASGREAISLTTPESGRSTERFRDSIPAMTKHAIAFLQDRILSRRPGISRSAA